MSHPHRLHAHAATWSLHTARQHLARTAAEEARAIALEAQEASDGLRAWQPLPGRCRGVHGDPAAGAALSRSTAPRVNRFAALAERTTGTLQWLAGQLRATAAGDPLARLQAAIPGMQPGTCATLTRWLQEADWRIRTALGIGDERRALLGIVCPACDRRRLDVQTAGPMDAWTVICGAGCVCVGEGCPCGMPSAVEGVAHIWPRDVVLTAAAVAGAAPAQVERTAA